jgi:hypothetical protein
MQYAKDTFYVALRDRLAVVNPARTVTVEGVVRPAVVVAENEGSLLGLENVFVVVWDQAQFVGNGTKLMKMMCEIQYATSGATDSGDDRGRLLGTLDGELMASLLPPRAMKTDYTQVPPASLGTAMFWTELEFGSPKDEAGKISRTANTTVYFYNGVGQ